MRGGVHNPREAARFKGWLLSGVCTPATIMAPARFIRMRSHA